MNQNRLLQDYFGRRPYPGTGVLEDYMQPAPQYAGPAMPPQRLGLSPQAEMGVSRYMNLDGGRGFSRANAERLYAQELEMQALQEQEQAMLDARAAEQAVTQVDPTSPQYSKQLSGILNRYGQAAVPALKGILPLQEVLRRAAQPEEVKDPYLNRITDPRAFQSYRQRRTAGMAPEQAWAQTLVETEEDDLMTQALQAGIPLADLQGMRQNGRLDKYKLLEATSAAKRNKPKELKAPRSLELKALGGLHDEILPAFSEPTDEEKKAWLDTNKRSGTEKDWQDAYNAVRTEKMANTGTQAEEFLMGIQDLVEGGYRVPEKYQKLASQLGYSFGEETAPARATSAVDPVRQTGPVAFNAEESVIPSQSVATETITTPQGQAKESERIVDPVIQTQMQAGPRELKSVDTGFETLRKEVISERSGKEAKRLKEARDAAAEQEKFVAETTPKWEAAKKELLKKMSVDLLRFPVAEYKSVSNLLGKKDNEEAFKDARGNSVSWGEVTLALMNDPRMREISTNQSPPPLDPRRKALRDKYKY